MGVNSKMSGWVAGAKRSGAPVSADWGFAALSRQPPVKSMLTDHKGTQSAICTAALGRIGTAIRTMPASLYTRDPISAPP